MAKWGPPGKAGSRPWREVGKAARLCYDSGVMRFQLLLAALAACAVFATTARADTIIVGVGLLLGMKEPGHVVKVMSVVPNSPAGRAGIPEGTRITKIDGVPTAGKGLEECVRKIRGPFGTSVRLEITLPGKTETMPIELFREAITSP